MYFLDNLLVSTTTSRSWRLRLPVLWLSKCFLPACRLFSFPVAVTRNRFLEALCVFILGMALPLVRGSRPKPAACPRLPSGQIEKGPWREPGVPGGRTKGPFLFG